MTIDQLSQSVCVFAVAYFVHSTVVVLLVAGLTRILSPGHRGHLAHLWVLAIIIPIVTGICQSQWSLRNDGWSWNLALLEPTDQSQDVLSLTVHDADLEAFSDSELIDAQPEAPLQTEIASGKEMLFLAGTEDSNSNDLKSTGEETVEADDVLPVAEFEAGSDPTLMSQVIPSRMAEYDPILLPESFAESDAFVIEPSSPDIEQNSETMTVQPMTAALPVAKVADRAEWWNLKIYTGMFLCSGLLLALADTLRRLMYLRSRLKQLPILTEGSIRDTVDRLASRSRQRSRITIYVSPALSEPAACGIIRRSVIVPEDLTDRLCPLEVEALLAHEVGHLVLRHSLVGALLQFLSTAMFWQPLNILVRRDWRRAAEEAADNWAVQAGVAPITLAKCLTNVATWRLAPAIHYTTTATATSLSRRVELLLDERSPAPARWRSVTTYVFFFCFIPGLIDAVPTIEWTTAANIKDLSTDEVAAVIDENVIEPNEVAEDSLGPTYTDLPVEESTLPESDPADPENKLLRQEFSELQMELNSALDLLHMQEQDPEIDAAIDAIRHRLGDIQTAIATLGELSSPLASQNDLTPNSQSHSGHGENHE